MLNNYFFFSAQTNSPFSVERVIDLIYSSVSAIGDIYVRSRF